MHSTDARSSAYRFIKGSEYLVGDLLFKSSYTFLSLLPIVIFSSGLSSDFLPKVCDRYVHYAS